MSEYAFITGDSALEYGRRAPADEQVLRDFETGENLRRIDPAELDELAAAASRTFDAANRDAAALVGISPTTAQLVRRLRVTERYTWRAVAAAVTERLPLLATWGSNQLFGMALCRAAAATFGEHYREAPWN